MNPILLQRLEALALLGVSLFLYHHSGSSWTTFLLLFLLPDLAMLGYLVNPRIGAACYNAAHNYLAPLLVALYSLPLAWIWLAHIGFDRALGYGLKYPTAFGDTHLGKLRGHAA